ncbi:hypothetical protein KFE25_014290 [Diacronema lutheri]|uniref:RAP domain-containing protein n=1 Tax=Diacronema lutheri TaxID=2081491 RepID=A0A8J6C7W0_DIALT|nr:hypothetical protein KFE25_014290 [Diacronema lutheri]
MFRRVWASAAGRGAALALLAAPRAHLVALKPGRVRRLALQAVQGVRTVRPAHAGAGADVARHARLAAPVAAAPASASTRWAPAWRINERLKAAPDARCIFAIVDEHARTPLSPSNVCTAWHRLGRALMHLGADERARVLGAHERTLNQMRRFVERDGAAMRPAQLAATAYGLARTGEPHARALLPLIAGLAASRLDECGARELANLAWSLANAGLTDHPLLERILPRALAWLPTLHADELTLLISAYAQRGPRGQQPQPHAAQSPAKAATGASTYSATSLHEAALLRAGAERARELAPELAPWHISTLLLAFASHAHYRGAAGAGGDHGGGGGVERDDEGTDAGDAQPVFAAGASACALDGQSCLSLPARALFRTIAKQQIGQLDAFSPRDLSMLVWAFAFSRTAHRKLFDVACAVATPQLGAYPCDALAQLLWAVSRAGYFSPGTSPQRVALYERAAAVASQRIDQMSWPTALLLFRAFVSVPSVQTAPYTLALAEHALPRLRRLDDRFFSYLLWSFTELNVRPPKLLAALSAEVQRRAHTLEPGTLAQIASATTVLGIAHPPVRAALVRAINAIPDRAVRELSTPTLTQLHIFAWETEYASAHAGAADAHTPMSAARAGRVAVTPLAVRADLRAAAESAMVAGVRPTSSYYHLLFSQSLEALGVPHENEHVVSDLGLGYCVDVALLHARVAIEINGPVHYDCARMLLPRTVLKHRLLRRAGWSVLSVPHYDWVRLTEPNKRNAYVCALLDALPGGVAAASAASSSHR